MSTVLELMEKRKKAWETAKAFLDSRRGSDGLISAEDNATYERMEADVVALGKEIERLQRQAAIDAELTKATSEPIKDKPGMKPGDKSQGMKQLMAGGGVALIGLTLVPLLSGLFG